MFYGTFKRQKKVPQSYETQKDSFPGQKLETPCTKPFKAPCSTVQVPHRKCNAFWVSYEIFGFDAKLIKFRKEPKNVVQNSKGMVFSVRQYPGKEPFQVSQLCGTFFAVFKVPQNTFFQSVLQFRKSWITSYM